MPWGIAAAGISAGAGLLQAGAVSGGQKSANAAQTMASAIQRNDLMPYSAQGLGATNRAANLLNLNGQEAADTALAQYRTSPGYQFQLDQGLRAVDAGAASKGLLRSGATLKAEQNFGAGLADSDFNNYYNQLFGLAKIGESAAAGQGAGAITTGQGIAQTDASAGQAQSSIYGNLGKGLATAFNDPGFRTGINDLFSGTPVNSPLYSETGARL